MRREKRAKKYVSLPSDKTGYDMCVIPDQSVFSCPPEQDGGAPPRRATKNTTKHTHTHCPEGSREKGPEEKTRLD